MPFALPPLFIVAIGAVGAAIAMRWVAKEARRVNADLERVRQAAGAEPPREAIPTLKRDPSTGEYRPS
jgi:hypothetical protein